MFWKDLKMSFGLLECFIFGSILHILTSKYFIEDFGAFLTFLHPLIVWLIKCQCYPHIGTSQLVCCANELTGFYMKITLTLNGLSSVVSLVNQWFKFWFLKFSCKVLSLYLSQEILIYSCKVQFLDDGEICKVLMQK